jgi:hypothetical protein
MERTLEAITKWLRKSGLVVNGAQTEVCLFYKIITAPVRLKIDKQQVPISQKFLI